MSELGLLFSAGESNPGSGHFPYYTPNTTIMATRNGNVSNLPNDKHPFEPVPRKDNPEAYRELIEKHMGTVIRIVPG
jgi:hypothetical protein